MPSAWVRMVRHVEQRCSSWPAATDCNVNEKMFVVIISTKVWGLLVTIAKLICH